jgi:hypothetical protein
MNNEGQGEYMGALRQLLVTQTAIREPKPASRSSLEIASDNRSI